MYFPSEPIEDARGTTAHGRGPLERQTAQADQDGRRMGGPPEDPENRGHDGVAVVPCQDGEVVGGHAAHASTSARCAVQRSAQIVR
jgi:hypothetical protein